MREQKGRGRPRGSSDPKTAAADVAIALSVYNLVTWGFPFRTRGNQLGCCEVVALEARSVLGRSDSNGLALGPDRVLKIFEGWFKAEQAARKESGRWPLRERWRYEKETLRFQVPDNRLSLEELARELLRNNGRWVRPGLLLPSGDLTLTPKAERNLGSPPRVGENVVEK